MKLFLSTARLIPLSSLFYSQKRSQLATNQKQQLQRNVRRRKTMTMMTTRRRRNLPRRSGSPARRTTTRKILETMEDFPQMKSRP
jgi:hypothetical protein